VFSFHVFSDLFSSNSVTLDIIVLVMEMGGNPCSVTENQNSWWQPSPRQQFGPHPCAFNQERAEPPDQTTFFNSITSLFSREPSQDLHGYGSNRSDRSTRQEKRTKFRHRINEQETHNPQESQEKHEQQSKDREL
jgi:hypothetical protein